MKSGLLKFCAGSKLLSSPVEYKFCAMDGFSYPNNYVNLIVIIFCFELLSFSKVYYFLFELNKSNWFKNWR